VTKTSGCSGVLAVVSSQERETCQIFSLLQCQICGAWVVQG